MEALKEPNLRLLSDLLATADGDLAIDVNKAYAEEKVNPTDDSECESERIRSLSILTKCRLTNQVCKMCFADKLTQVFHLQHKTLLHVAAERGDAEAVRIIIAAGADTNLR